MTRPLVSIVVPCYNQANNIYYSASSLLEQTYVNWECVIVNDGSTDNSQAVIDKLCKKDSRFKFVQKKNGGLASARNAGVNSANGRFVQFLDADDTIDKEKLALSVEVFNRNPDIDFVLSDFVMYHVPEKKYVFPAVALHEIDLTYSYILHKWDPNGFNIPIHSPIYKADIFQTYRFPEGFRAQEDYVFHLQVFKNRGKYISINKPLAIYNKHGANMTHNRSHMLSNMIKANQYIMDNILDENDKEGFFTKINSFWGSQVLSLLEEINSCHKTNRNLMQSMSYRLGRRIISPIAKLRGIFSK